MTPQTILLRQVHPSFIQFDRVTSQAFRPSPKDEHKLSVDDGDKISAEAAWQRFCSQLNCRSIGVLGITVDECKQRRLSIIEDGVPHPEHVSLDFQGIAKKQIESIAKQLAADARKRGWLFRVDHA